jgi:alpha-1,2-mannosyltransferase
VNPPTKQTRMIPLQFRFRVTSRQHAAERAAARSASATRSQSVSLLPKLLALVFLAGTVTRVVLYAVETREVDLGTYLFGAAHVFGSRLYQVVYPYTHLGYTYPPFLAVLLSPFAHLPLVSDRVGFGLVSIGALVLIIGVSLRAARPQLVPSNAWWWSIGLAFPASFLVPVSHAFSFGQVDLIVVGLALVDVVHPQGIPVPFTRRRIPQGVLVGLAAAIKLTPLVLIPVLFIAGRKRAASLALLSFVGAAALTVLLASRASFEYWVHYVFDVRRIGSAVWIANQSLRGVILRLAHHEVSTVATDALGVGVLLVGIPLAAACYRRTSPLHCALVAFAAEGLASPVTWTHQMVWVVGLVVWLALSQDWPKNGVTWAAIVALICWAGPNWWVPHARGTLFTGHGWELIVGDTFAILSAITIVVAAALLWRTATEGLRFRIRSEAPNCTISPTSDASAVHEATRESLAASEQTPLTPTLG